MSFLLAKSGGAPSCGNDERSLEEGEKRVKEGDVANKANWLR